MIRNPGFPLIIKINVVKCELPHFKEKNPDSMFLRRKMQTSFKREKHGKWQISPCRGCGEWKDDDQAWGAMYMRGIEACTVRERVS